MFIIIPRHSSARVGPLVGSMFLLFLAGIFLGSTVMALLVARAQLSVYHLLAIPVAGVVGFVCLKFWRRIFKKEDFGGAEGSVLSSVGASGAIVFFFVFCSLGGGMWLGGYGTYDTRNYRPYVPVRARTINPASLPAVAASPTLKLQSILYNATKPSAMVNGNTVFVGDEISGWKVTVIDPKGVTFQDASGRIRTLVLK